MSEEGIIRESKMTDRFDWNSRDGVTFDASRELLATYTLQVFGPQEFSFRNAVALKMRWDELARETEENWTGLLPAGYHVEIKEWDSE